MAKFSRADLMHEDVQLSLSLEDIRELFCVEMCPSCGYEAHTVQANSSHFRVYRD